MLNLNNVCLAPVNPWGVHYGCWVGGVPWGIQEPNALLAAQTCDVGKSLDFIMIN